MMRLGRFLEPSKENELYMPVSILLCPLRALWRKTEPTALRGQRASLLSYINSPTYPRAFSEIVAEMAR